MNRKTNGFTLVEVIIAVAILAVVSVPVMKIFIQTANIDSVARQTQKATDIAQNIVEGIKEYSMEEIIDQCMSVKSDSKSLAFLTDWSEGYTPKAEYVKFDNIDDNSSTLNYIQSKYGDFGVYGNAEKTENKTNQEIAIDFKGDQIRFAIRGIKYPSDGPSYDVIVSFEVNGGTTANKYILNGDTYYLYNFTVSVYQNIGGDSVKRATLHGAVQNKPNTDIVVGNDDDDGDNDDVVLCVQNNSKGGHVIHNKSCTECSVVQSYLNGNNNSVKLADSGETLESLLKKNKYSKCEICFKEN